MSLADIFCLSTVLIVPVVLFFGIAIRMDKYWRKSNRDGIEMWRHFAQEYDLEFFRGGLFDKAIRVTGSYRDYLVDIFLSEYKNRKQGIYRLYTNIHLSTTNRDLRQNNGGNSNSAVQEIAEPAAGDIVKVLIPNGLVCYSRAGVEIGVEENKVQYRQEGFEEDEEYLLKVLHMLCDLVDNYPMVINLGGVAVSELETLADYKTRHPLEMIAADLLKTIAGNSKKMEKSNLKFTCPRCYMNFRSQHIKLSRWIPTYYFACPKCHQNRDYHTGDVVAVLNEQTKTECFRNEDVLEINWLVYRKTFDFDSVIIEQATDEDVERFVIQSRNDTGKSKDIGRVSCKVRSTCSLSENTMRILSNTFSAVEIVEAL